MKTLLKLLIFILFSNSSFTQERVKYQKETCIVLGNCNMCKKKIEKTAKLVVGVKGAKWNVITGKLKLKFNPEMTDLVSIEKAVAGVGYDTERYKATEESYNSLHYCCKYERKK